MKFRIREQARVEGIFFWVETLNEDGTWLEGKCFMSLREANEAIVKSRIITPKLPADIIHEPTLDLEVEKILLGENI